MDQIGSNRCNWTELAKLDRIDLGGVNRPKSTVWTKLDRIDLIGPNWPIGPNRPN